MSEKNRYSARLPDDQAQELEQYRKERDLSKSEAIRRSVDELVNENRDSSSNRLGLDVSLSIGILYLVLYVSYPIPALASILVGTGLLLSLLFQYRDYFVSR